MVSKRSRACDFSKAEREAIKERDTVDGVPACIVCGATCGLQIAHYIPRSAGGLGIRQNGIILCAYHHRILDQGADRAKREEIHMAVKKRLETHYRGFTDDMRKYKKGVDYGLNQ